MKTAPFSCLAAAIGLLSLAGAARAEEMADQAGLDFFEKKIRPVLAEKCYKCHSADADKIKGGLVLDTREGARRGGDSGPAVIPGNLKESLLIEAIHYENKDFAMPPKKSGGKLDEATIKDFEKWIAMGAPDPREEKGAPAASAKVTQKQDNWATAKDWWAWQRPAKTKTPAPKNDAWARTAIDRFLLSAMEEKGIQPVGDADKMTLLRRVYFDLVGLPPTPADVRAFYADSSDAAYEKLVDKLLGSAQFGERWGRHWLDVARYAESCGKDANIAYPHAWRYRDYVIDAFNRDKPYNEFIREQLAGDLLPAKTEKQKAEHLVATGFLAIGPKSLNEMNPRQFALDLADEQIDATSQAFLGLTVACARCHDHKFDPIPQKEYYSLAGIFLSTETKYGTAAGLQNRHASTLVELPKEAAEPVLNKTMSASERQQKQARVAELQKEMREMFQGFGQGKGGPPSGQKGARLLQLVTQNGLLERELANFDENGQPRALAMGVQDLPATRPGFGGFGGRYGGGMFGRGFGQRPGAPDAGGGPSGGGAIPALQRLQGRYARPSEFQVITDSPVYARGDADKPGDKTPRGFLTLLTTTTPPPIPPGTSGRRELAEWIASPMNPLTARVMVNRVWHWVFGEGIVSTPDNFGTTGNKPSNQALLDTLAVRFEQDGWSVKKLVREIVLSHAYRLASTYNEQNFSADPENTLHWRMNKRRLDAESIRDAILFTSGQLTLQPRPYVGSVIAYSGDGPVGLARFFGISEESIVDSGNRSNLRSVYLPIARDILPDVLAVFDFAETSMVSGNRDSTNVPSQALFLLNSPFVANASQKFAERVINTYPAGPNAAVGANFEQRVTMAYWMAYSRGPTPAERRAAADFFAKFPGNWKRGDTQTSPLHDGQSINAAWTSFCRALFASAEFRYLN